MAYSPRRRARAKQLLWSGLGAAGLEVVRSLWDPPRPVWMHLREFLGTWVGLFLLMAHLPGVLSPRFSLWRLVLLVVANGVITLLIGLAFAVGQHLFK